MYQHLHQCIEKHERSANGQQLEWRQNLEANVLIWSTFQSKRNVKENWTASFMRFFLLVTLNRILALSLTLSMQNVSHRTMLSQSLHLNHIYNTLLHFLSHLFVNTSLHLTWTFQLDNAVMRTAKFCWFLIPLVFLFWNVSQKLL